MKEKKLIPKRRFKEFENDGAWEQRKLGEIAERYDNLRIPVKESDRVPGDTPYYGANGIQDYVEGFTHDGEFVLVAEDGANDLKNYPVHYVNGKVWVNNHAHVIQAIRDISNNKFIQYSFKTLNIEPYLVGGSRAKLNANIMMDLIMKTPSLMEQEKIGDFFSNLNNLITLHQRKLKKLKETKSAYLSEMFPKEGEKYPKRRFSGFTDPWEQRKLDDIADVRDGTHDSPQYYSGGHPFITSKNVKDGYINYDDIHYISDTDFEMINKRSKVDKNDILMGMIGTIGNIALVREEPDFAIKNVALIKNENKIYYVYLYYNLQSSSILNQLSEGMDGGTQKFIALNKIRNLSISYPKYEEQLRIGSFFERLDNLITLHQCKLEKLENLKKAYLNEMFV